MVKANLTKVRDAKPRVLASTATLYRRKEPKIAGLPITKSTDLRFKSAACFATSSKQEKAALCCHFKERQMQYRLFSLGSFLMIAFMFVGCVTQGTQTAEPLDSSELRKVVVQAIRGDGVATTVDVSVPHLLMPETITSYSPKPTGWPAPIPWRPRRHFGLFKEGSDLSQIQVLLNGTSATWHFNDFFAGEPQFAKNIFRIYYRQNFASSPSGVVLPTDNSPTLANRPGDVFNRMGISAYNKPPAITESTNGAANNILLSLRQIRYSSKFGGSLAFHFRTAENTAPTDQILVADDFEYEFAKGDLRFDLNGLRMILYVNPRVGSFNPKVNGVSMQTVGGIEFSYNGYTAYKDVLPVRNESAEARLKEAITTVGKGVVQSLVSMDSTAGTNLRPPASVFAHAWMHNQFTDLIGNNDKVVKALIKTNWADLVTEQYQPYVFARWKLRMLFEESEFSYFDEIGNEYEIKIKVFHIPEGSSDKLLIVSQTLDEFEEISDESDWVTLWGGKVQECRLINHIELQVHPKELDTLSADDRYVPAVIDYQLDCAAIEAQAARSVYVGIVPRAIVGGTSNSFVQGETRGADFAPQEDDSGGARIFWSARVDMTAR